MRGYRGTCSATAPLTLLLITSMLGAAITTAAFVSTESVRVYLVITVSVRINIVYKWVTDIAKDV